MKLEIYEEEKKEEETIKLKLVQKGDYVKLVAVQENGNCSVSGSLLDINVDGIYIYSGINASLGFKLNENGRLKVEGQ